MSGAFEWVLWKNNIRTISFRCLALI